MREPVVVCKICGSERPLFATNRGTKPLNGILGLAGGGQSFRFCNDTASCVRGAQALMKETTS